MPPEAVNPHEQVLQCDIARNIDRVELLPVVYAARNFDQAIVVWVHRTWEYCGIRVGHAIRTRKNLGQPGALTVSLGWKPKGCQDEALYQDVVVLDPQHYSLTEEAARAAVEAKRQMKIQHLREGIKRLMGEVGDLQAYTPRLQVWFSKEAAKHEVELAKAKEAQDAH